MKGTKSKVNSKIIKRVQLKEEGLWDSLFQIPKIELHQKEMYIEAGPRWAQKLIFHIRIVKRNRGEIEAQKKQILSTQQRQRK